MKKFLSVILCAALLLSVLTFVGCGKTDDKETLKLGLGVYSETTKATNADGETNGEAEADITAAAVLVDADGKIVKCVIDTAQDKVNYTSEGKAVAKESFKTKYELKNDYGMSAHGSDFNGDGVVKEWYEQVDSLCALVVGKTLDEVKALVVDGDKGTDDVLNAGCTITISGFIYAIEKAMNNAVASDATADSALKLGMDTEQSCTDATADSDGTNEVDVTVFAAAIGADNKIVAASSDCVQVKFTFNAAGESTYDLTKTLTTKKELGTGYNMSAYGTDRNGDGVVKEWNEQAAAFEAACIGKTAGDVKSLMGDDDYGTDELQNAGCTIHVNSLVAAASKVG